MNYGGGSPSMSCRWIWWMGLCLAMNGSLPGMAPFTKVIGFDLRVLQLTVRADGKSGFARSDVCYCSWNQSLKAS
jgi:hypothetical protein